VLDGSGQPIAGAQCELAGLELETETDNEGRYVFVQGTAVKGGTASDFVPYVQDGRLFFHVKENMQSVHVSMRDAKGRQLGTPFSFQYPSGHHQVDMEMMHSDLPSGIYFIQLRIGSESFYMKGAGLRDAQGPRYLSLAPYRHTSLSKRAAGVDSVHCYLEGYENEVVPVDNFSGTVTDMVLNAGVAFEPYFKGSGEITDLSTGQTIFIPYEQRLHTVVFAEGYTQQDLDDGEYEQDMESWFNDVFVLDVMDYFREACVIWKFSASSNEHLTGDGVVDSYFRLPLSGGLMAGSGYEEPAAITWEKLAYFPFPPQTYPSRLYARNLVCSYVLFDADRNRSGFSGQARSFTNPNDNEQRVNVAMARGHQHEWMHSMAKLSDEYYDRGHRPASSSSLRQESRYISNVVSSNACDSVPWAHLFQGGAINPDADSLIGAFGTNGRYHPELKCLLNGSHHNSDLYGGSNNLRTNGRLCNWCRELVSFRIYERTYVLPDIAESWDTWAVDYRAPFYEELGFFVPEVVPQENSEGTQWFLPCQ
jgi:hypothetical protein